MATRNLDGKFLPGTSGNPGGRASYSARRFRDLLEVDVDMFAAKLRELALAGDPVALKLVIERLFPAPKPGREKISLPALFNADTFDARATAVLDAVARAELGPDDGAQLLSALSGALRVHEVDELARRIAALEKPNTGEDLL